MPQRRCEKQAMKAVVLLTNRTCQVYLRTVAKNAKFSTDLKAVQARVMALDVEKPSRLT